MPTWLGVAIAFIYGAVVGSFLNVCIWRLPRDESIVRPGSHCTKCDTPLKARDLVPFLSFLVQRCRCRYCGEPISWRYFGVELLTGVYFGLTYYWFGWGLDFLAYALFGAALIAIFFIDLEHWIIPDQLSVFGIAVGVTRDVIGLSAGTAEPYWIGPVPVPRSIAGLLVCGAAFLALAVISEYIFKKEGIGGGDIKLAAAVGANLAIGPAMLSFMVAVFFGAVIGVGLIIARRKTRKDYVPFGPMMVVGALVVLFLGDRIVDLWMQGIDMWLAWLDSTVYYGL